MDGKVNGAGKRVSALLQKINRSIYIIRLDMIRKQQKVKVTALPDFDCMRIDSGRLRLPSCARSAACLSLLDGSEQAADGAQCSCAVNGWFNEEQQRKRKTQMRVNIAISRPRRVIHSRDTCDRGGVDAPDFFFFLFYPCEEDR